MPHLYLRPYISREVTIVVYTYLLLLSTHLSIYTYTYLFLYPSLISTFTYPLLYLPTYHLKGALMDVYLTKA